MKYNDIGVFMGRFPLAHKHESVRSEDDLIRLCDNPIFKEKLLIASRSIFESFEKYLASPELFPKKKKKRLLSALSKYYFRSQYRTTPFGLFAAVSVGKVAAKENYRINQKHKKVIQLDSEWLMHFLQKIEQEYPEFLMFQFNQSIVRDSSRAGLLYKLGSTEQQSSIRLTNVFAALDEVLATADFIAYRQMIDAIALAYPETDQTVMEAYVKTLISEGYLISELRPAVQQFDVQYIKKLAFCLRTKIPRSGLGEKLGCLAESLIAYEKLPVGAGIQQYLACIDSMQLLAKSKSYLQVDCEQESSALTLSYQSMNEIKQFANMLNKLAIILGEKRQYFAEYKAKFMEAYGVERLVPITMMLHETKGIGEPKEFLSQVQYTAQYENQKFVDALHEKILAAMIHNTHVELTDEDIDVCFKDEMQDKKSHGSNSLDLYLIVKKSAGKNMFYLSPTAGANRAGKTFGRFANHQNQFGRAIAQIAQKLDRQMNVEIGSFNFITSQMRSTNVVREIVASDFEISLHTNGTPSKAQLAFDDIFVGLSREEDFYFVNHKTGKQIYFAINNMFNPLLKPKPIRFIDQAQALRETQWFNFLWHDFFNKHHVLPKICYKNFVISARKWLLRRDQILQIGKSLHELRGYLQKRDIPQQFYVVHADNRFPVTQDNDYALSLFVQESKKLKNDYIQIEEREEGEDVLTDQLNVHLPLEIVVPLVNETVDIGAVNAIPSTLEVDQAQRLKWPFDEWLYFDLYCQKEQEAEFLAIKLGALIRDLREHDCSVGYFFIRYFDEAQHIRLRFHATQPALMQLYPTIFEWLKDCQVEGYLEKFTIRPYEREIERYGGVELMQVCEKLFELDSNLTLALLTRHIIEKEELIELAISSIFFMLQPYFNDYEALKSFFANYEEKNEWQAEWQAKKDLLLVQNKIENPQAFNSTFCDALNDDIANPIAYLLQAEQLSTLLDQQPTSKIPILMSLMHMHANRLLGTKRELEAKIMFLCRKIVYAKAYTVQARLGE